MTQRRNSSRKDTVKTVESRLIQSRRLDGHDNGATLVKKRNAMAHEKGDEEWISLGATQEMVCAPQTLTKEQIANATEGNGARSQVDPEHERTMNSEFGDFQIIKKLGQGAMATVYKVRDRNFDRKVALKILHKSVAENPKLVERFYREARATGSLDHPNIVQGYSVGDVDGVHYFAMEYVSGITLQDWLNKTGKLRVSDAIFIAIACTRALEYAHANGLVHRDIKPDNILITRKGEIKVADLGMVKSIDEDMSLTQTGHAVGTPWYMPLEQAKNAKGVDGRCDIYALGCMLYCMLTGKPPFVGDNIVEVIKMKETGTFPPARQVNRDVPDRLDLIIMKMTAKEPKHRYLTCGDLARDLESLGLAGESLSFHRDSEPAEEHSDLEWQQETKVASSVSKDVWYLRRKRPDGKVSVVQYTTNQLIELVENAHISPSSKVSHAQPGNYRSLASFKEFEQAALKIVSRKGADAQTQQYRNLYKKIEQEGDKRKQKVIETDKEQDESIDSTLRTGVIIMVSVVGAIVQFWLIFMLARALGA